MATSTTIDLILNARDKASKEVEKLNGTIKKLGKDTKINMEKATNASKLFAGALAAAGAGVVAMGASLAKAGSESDRALDTFSKLAASLGETEIEMTKLRDATLNIVDDTTILQQGNKLMSMGLAESQEEMAKMMNTAVRLGQAMGTGATESMENFALMLANQSIPRLDTFGISSGKVRVRINELMEANKDMTRETAFMTATMEQAESSLQKLGDYVPNAGDRFKALQVQLANIWGTLGQELLPAFERLVGLLEGAANRLPALIDKIKQLTTFFAENKTAMVILSGVILGALTPAIIAATAAAAGLAVSLAPFMIAGAVIAGVVAGLLWLRDNWGQVTAFLTKVVTNFTTSAKARWEELKTALAAITENIKTNVIDGFTGLVNGATGLYESLVASITSLTDKIMSIFNDLVAQAKDIGKNFIMNIVNGIKGAIGSAVSSVKNAAASIGNAVRGAVGFANGGMVGFANGGQVRGFANGGRVGVTDTVPAMLTPGEVVLNAAQQRNLAGHLRGGNGTTVVVNVDNMYGDEQFVRILGDAIVKDLRVNLGGI